MLEPGTICGKEVKIEIISSDKNITIAKVLEVNEFWSSRPTGPEADQHEGLAGRGHVKNFEPGMLLVFDGHKIIKPKWLPWFSLRSDGSFEHYR